MTVASLPEKPPGRRSSRRCVPAGAARHDMRGWLRQVLQAKVRADTGRTACPHCQNSASKWRRYDAISTFAEHKGTQCESSRGTVLWRTTRNAT